jgi:hypothetical protein
MKRRLVGAQRLMPGPCQGDATQYREQSVRRRRYSQAESALIHQVKLAPASSIRVQRRLTSSHASCLNL